MNHQQAAYDGQCITCGLSKWQQVSYPDCVTYKPVYYKGSLSFGEFVAHHVACAADCERGYVYTPAPQAAGPWICGNCLDEALELTTAWGQS